MKYLLILGALAALLTAAAGSALALHPPTMEWQYTYGGGQMDVCYAMAPYGNGYILVGKTASNAGAWPDAYVVWTDANGIMTGEARHNRNDNDCEFRSVIVDPQFGNWTAAGVFSPQGGTTKDIWLHGEGTFTNCTSPWDATFGTTAQDVCNAIAPIRSILGRGYLVLGSKTYENRQDGYCFLTTDCGVSVPYMSARKGNRNYNDEFKWGIQTSGGGYVLAGALGRAGGTDDAWLMCLRGTFTERTSKAYGSSGQDRAVFVGETPDSGFIIAGSTSSYGAGGLDFYLIRTDYVGNLIWHEEWGTTGNDECLAALIDTTGEYVLAGTTGSPRHAALIKYNDAGELLWSMVFGGAGDMVCNTLIQTADMGYLLGGMADSSGSGNYDVWLMKTGREGPRGNVTLEVPGPSDWDYRLHWVSGSLGRLTFRNLCLGTHGFCSDAADLNGWHATDYTDFADSVVFTTSNPLTSGSLHGFHLYSPQCSDIAGWLAGDNSGFVAGPSPPPFPVCADYEASFDPCTERERILSGTTVFGEPACAFRPSNDQGWAVSIIRPGCYTFDMCANAPGGANAWDSYLYLTRECCNPDSVIASNDNCPGVSAGQSRIDSISLSSGTYYLVVEGYDTEDQGDYTITITCCSTVPHSDQVDLGDLTACNYPTLAGSPAHELTGVAWLGAGVTAEASPNVLDWDLNDDGVVFLNPPWDYCETHAVMVTVTAGPNWEQYQQEGGCLYLNAWKDGNMDGDFCDTIDCGYWGALEWIIQDMQVSADVHGLTYYVILMDPGDWRLGCFAGVFRFRLSSRPLGPFGFGLLDTAACPQMRCGTVDRDPVGEVEDYIIQDMQTAVELTSFEAIAGDGRVTLCWVTASETDNDRFEIWRGESEEGTFSEIARIPSHGNSAGEQHYAYLDTDVEPGVTYWYFLADVDIGGTRTEHRDRMVSARAEEATPLATEYALHQNYPNPFNPTTTLQFDLKEAGVVTLKAFDPVGREVATLLNRHLDAGTHSTVFDGRALTSGLYFYRLEVNGFAATRKMLLIK